MAAREADEVSLTVAKEGHPLLPPGRAEHARIVAVDQMRLGVDGHARRAQGVRCRPDVVDPEVDQGAGDVAVQQEPRVAKPEKRQARRIEPGDQLAAKYACVESDGTIKIIGVLGYLVELSYLHRASPVELPW